MTSTGVFDFVSRLLEGVANQQGSEYTAPPICEALLVEMQAKCDSGEIFLPTSHSTATSTTSHPTALFFTAHSSPQQPGPSRAHSSTQAGISQTRKRQSPGDRGPGGKRRREGTPSRSQYPPTRTTRHLLCPRPAPAMPTCTTSTPQLDDSDMELSSPSVSPVVIRPPVVRRYRLRTAPTQTDLYQEPEQPNCGVSGTESNAIPVCMPSRPRQRPLMASCTNCYCPLQRAVINTAARPAICTLCGSYKAKKVSLCIFYS